MIRVGIAGEYPGFRRNGVAKVNDGDRARTILCMLKGCPQELSSGNVAGSESPFGAQRGFAIIEAPGIHCKISFFFRLQQGSPKFVDLEN